MKPLRPIILVQVPLLWSCSGSQSALDPGGDQSERLFTLFRLMILVCGIAYALVILFLMWSLWRKQRDGGKKRADRLLRLWGGLIIIGLTLLVAASFLADRHSLPPVSERTLAIRITGHQWWWRIEYRGMDGKLVETANELHLPMGRPVRIELRAADVIHSFWVPNLAGKTDMIPGRSNIIWLTPRRIGHYRAQCAEFCGMQHANMALPVTVESPPRFERWMEGQARVAAAPEDRVVQGYDLFLAGSCATCHSIRGTSARGRVGPDLTHLVSRTTLAAATVPLTHASLRGWILNPQGIKPGSAMPASDLSPQDAEAVARYLETLR